MSAWSSLDSYETVICTLVEDFGYTCTEVQHHLRTQYGIERGAFQSQSRQNHAAERKWVEINTRINYPIKHALCYLTNNGFLDMDDPFVKHRVSCIASKCCMVGLQNFVPAWNAHTIPQKGIPDGLFAADLRTAQIPSHLIPPAEVVAADYISNGGSLTYPSPYGQDPLDGYPDRQLQRENLWSSTYQCDHIFNATLMGNSGVFWDAVDMYMNITHHLEP